MSLLSICKYVQGKSNNIFLSVQELLLLSGNKYIIFSQFICSTFLNLAID